MLEILSLGAGHQSTTLLRMSLEGYLDFPKLDAAVFADTKFETQAVYDNVRLLGEYAAKHDVPIYRVSAGDLKEHILTRQVPGIVAAVDAVAKKSRGARKWSSMPMFVLGPTGKLGMLRRQCTRDYKLNMINQFEREHFLGLRKGQRGPAGAIRQWVGFSLDEFMRAGNARKAREKWCVKWYPLIEKRITRQDCLDWLKERGFPIPPRSACIGCPYKSNVEWRLLRDTSPDEFEEACQFDEAIRHCGGMRGQVFLHAKRIPLREVNLKTDGERGQLSLWQDECSGMCGV